MTETLEKTITETGKATRALTKVGEDLAKAMSNVQSYVTTVEALNDEIEVKTAKLAGLDKEFAEALREKQVDLTLKIKENENTELGKLLAKNKVVAVAQTELDSLKSAVENAETVKTNAVTEAVRASEATLKAAHANALTVRDLEHKASQATSLATLESLQSKIDYLTASNTALEAQLNAEREARVTIAQAATAPVVNVGATGRS